MHSNETTDFAEQINEGLDEILSSDQKALIMGLGVTDPKGIFGTTLGLIDAHSLIHILGTTVSICGTNLASLCHFNTLLLHQCPLNSSR